MTNSTQCIMGCMEALPLFKPVVYLGHILDLCTVSR